MDKHFPGVTFESTPTDSQGRTRVKQNRVFFPVDSAKPIFLAVVSLDVDRDIGNFVTRQKLDDQTFVQALIWTIPSWLTTLGSLTTRVWKSPPPFGTSPLLHQRLCRPG
jgi:hypothetical protein